MSLLIPFPYYAYCWSECKIIVRRHWYQRLLKWRSESHIFEVKGHNTYPSFSDSSFVSWGSSILSNFVIVFSVLLVSSDNLLTDSCSFSANERRELAGSAKSESSKGLGSLDRLDDAKLLLEDRVFLEPCLLKGSESIQINHYYFKSLYMFLFRFKLDNTSLISYKPYLGGGGGLKY